MNLKEIIEYLEDLINNDHEISEDVKEILRDALAKLKTLRRKKRRDRQKQVQAVIDLIAKLLGITNFFRE